MKHRAPGAHRASISEESRELRERAVELRVEARARVLRAAELLARSRTQLARSTAGLLALGDERDAMRSLLIEAAVLARAGAFSGREAFAVPVSLPPGGVAEPIDLDAAAEMLISAFEECYAAA